MSGRRTTAAPGKHAMFWPPGLPLAPLRALAAESPLELTVTGVSMAPAIPSGARVSVRPARRYLPGDVVAFLGRDGRLRVHRLLGACPTRRGLRFLTRGDAAPARDPAIAPADLLGRVETIDGARLRVRPADRLRALAGLLLPFLHRRSQKRQRALADHTLSRAEYVPGTVGSGSCKRTSTSSWSCSE